MTNVSFWKFGTQTALGNIQSGYVIYHSQFMHLPLRASIGLGLIFATAFPALGLPMAQTASTLLSALPDRDVVRNSYRAGMGAANLGSISAAHISPAVQLSIPPATFGGYVSSLGSSFASLGGLIGFAPRPSGIFDIVLPRNFDVYFSFSSAPPRQSNVTIGAVQVPDGGVTVVLLGLSLLAMHLFRGSATGVRLMGIGRCSRKVRRETDAQPKLGVSDQVKA
ncbi:MAG: hypothetical protein ACREH8_10095 [Opitutaceae bacterium]